MVAKVFDAQAEVVVPGSASCTARAAIIKVTMMRNTALRFTGKVVHPAGHSCVRNVLLVCQDVARTKSSLGQRSCLLLQ